MKLDALVPCPVCALYGVWMPMQAFLAQTAFYARLRCDCPGHGHRLSIPHPHTPEGCQGFTVPEPSYA